MRTTHRRKSALPFRSTPLAVALAGLLPFLAMAQTPPSSPFNVTNVFDGGAGSLRQAIMDANANCTTGARINFNLGTGPFTIAPSTALPDIACPGLAIVGTGNEFIGGGVINTAYGGPNSCGAGFSVTVPGVKITGLQFGQWRSTGANIAICGPVTVEGSSIQAADFGIQIQGGNGSIGGLAPSQRNVIYANSAGINVVSGAAATIIGNYIGTPDGSSAAGNSIGVHLQGNASTVASNVISGNTSGIGIYVNDGGGSTISNNLIGTDAGGTLPLPNVTGIQALKPVTISGNTIGASNTGVQMDFPGSLTGNKIGTNSSGASGLGNRVGVRVSTNGSGTSITGVNIVAGNTEGIVFEDVTAGLVSGNQIVAPASGSAGDFGINVYCSSGVQIFSNTIAKYDVANVGLYGSSGLTFNGNTIRDAFGPTNGYGVYIGFDPCIPPSLVAPDMDAKRLTKANSSGNVFINNTITGNNLDGIHIADGNGNQISGGTITGNKRSGVAILAGVGNSITNASISGNLVKNIDLANPAANNGQVAPVVLGVTRFPTQTAIDYAFDSPAGNFVIEVFANPAADIPAGKTPIDTFQVTTAGSPIIGKRVLNRTDVDFISLTATRLSPANIPTDTSEFSAVKAAVIAPAVAIAPSAINFGNVTTDATATQPITLSSVGGLPWVLTGFASDNCTTATPMCSGTAFICTNNNCAPGTYPPGNSCTITATFAPQSAGPANTTIFVCDNAGGSQITLSGNGVLPPAVTIAPTSFDFGAVVVGTQSATQSFTVTNPASASTALGAPTPSGDFIVIPSGTDCGTSLGAGQSCTVALRFTPIAAGARAGALQMTFGSGRTTAIPLTGTGTAILQLTAPGSIDFGTHIFGLDPVVRTATLLNSGTTAVTISSITATGPFALTNGCPTSLVAGASCVLTLSFSSTTVGAATGNISISSNATGGLQLIALTGIVAPAPIHIEPVRFDFGPVVVGRTSAPQNFVIVNASDVAVALGPVQVTGSFTIVSTNCTATLVARLGCDVQVQFAPSQAGAANETLFVPFGTGAKARAVGRGAKAVPTISAAANLSGTGVNVAQIEVPGLIEFGTLVAGGSPIVRTATITSTGNAVINISSITVNGPFTLTHDCPINLPLPGSCTLTITFNTATLGPASGIVTIASNATGSPHLIALGGLVQLRPVPVITVNPIAITFGSRLIGTQSPSVRLTIANEGGAPAALGPLSVSSDYVIVNTSCGATLASQDTCTADVAMRPVGFGDRSGTFFFTSNADSSPHRVNINGIGCRPFTTGNNRTGGGNSACSP